MNNNLLLMIGWFFGITIFLHGAYRLNKYSQGYGLHTFNLYGKNGPMRYNVQAGYLKPTSAKKSDRKNLLVAGLTETIFGLGIFLLSSLFL